MWKNLLSYGNKIQTYEFSDEPKLVLVEGENGAGKSTIKEAMTISAYGKSHLRKMKDLPNWRNRAAYTYNEVETDKGDIVIIERGIDPNFTEIKINGVRHNLPDKRKVDDFIESEVLNLNFSTFCNTISLSFDDFKSFVNLSPSDKRKIVDPIFGIDILSDMRSEAKNESKNSKKNLDISVAGVTKNQELLDKSIAELEALDSKISQSISEKEKSIKDEIEVEEGKKEKYRTEFNKLNDKISDINTKSSKLNNSIIDSKNKISDFNNKLKIYSQNKCPHCLSDLTGDASDSIKKSIEEKKKLEEELYDKMTSNMSKVKDLVKKITEDLSASRSDFYSAKSSVESLKKQLEGLKNDTQDDQKESIMKIMETIKSDLESSKSDSARYREECEIYEAIDEVLSDTGIKRSLIDKVIPILNNRIEEISERLDFKFSFSFDFDFNPVINYLGMEISPESLSTGQRKKMNLIVLLSFIELIKMKHGSLNAMFLDEIFSGLDKKNVYKAIEILREYADNYKMTIFVVSHETLPQEFFDDRILVKMNNHFSEMEVVSNSKKG